MPGTPNEFLEKLERCNIRELAVETIEQTKDAYLNLNRDQLRHGDKSSSKGIGIYASMEYAAEKYRLNPLAGMGRVDLMLTHSFERSMFMDVYAEKFLVGSQDQKSDQLESDYGSDIFGLIPSNQQSYNFDIVLPKFVTLVRERLGIVAN